MPKPTKKKILANVWKPLATKLKEAVDGACLQRDAYLDRVFSREAEMLDKEMGEPNSKEARSHLANHLALLDRKQVNFALSPETVDAINDVCARKNVPRDCFINRILLFLLAKDQRTLFERIFDERVYWYWGERVVPAYEGHPPLIPYHLEGGLAVLKNLSFEDPFWAIRACIGAEREEAETQNLEGFDLLHCALLPKNFFGGDKVESALGFNCRLPDSLVDGHPTQLAEQRLWDDLWKDLKAERPNKEINERKTGGGHE